MDRQSDLLPVICSNRAGVKSPPVAFARVSNSFSLGLPLPLVPSTFPVTHPLSSCSSLITWPRNLKCRCLIFFIIPLLALACCNTISLLTRSVRDIFNILLYKQSSVSSIFHSISLLMVQASQPYVKVDKTYAYTNLFGTFKDIEFLFLEHIFCLEILYFPNTCIFRPAPTILQSHWYLPVQFHFFWIHPSLTSLSYSISALSPWRLYQGFN